MRGPFDQRQPGGGDVNNRHFPGYLTYPEGLSGKNEHLGCISRRGDVRGVHPGTFQLLRGIIRRFGGQGRNARAEPAMRPLQFGRPVSRSIDKVASLYVMGRLCNVVSRILTVDIPHHMRLLVSRSTPEIGENGH